MRIEGVVEEEEADNETLDQYKEKVSNILKFKLKRSNVKLERAHRIPRKERSHNKDKPRTMFFKLHSYEDKESLMRNVYQLKDTGYYINKDKEKGKATLNIRAELWDEVKRLRGKGYFTVIKYDRIVTNKRDEVAQ